MGLRKPAMYQADRVEALRVDREPIMGTLSHKPEAECTGLQKPSVPEAVSFVASHAEEIDNAGAVDAETDKAGGGGPANFESTANRDLNALTGKELQAELRSHGLKVSGKKAELVARLRSHEAEADSKGLHKSALPEAVSFTANHAEVVDNADVVNSKADKVGGGGPANHKSTVNRDLSALTVKELKEKLRNHGLKVSGNKADLIARLSHEAVAET